MEFRKLSSSSKWVFFVLGIILLLLGLGAIGENVYAAGVYVIVGIVQILIAGTGLTRTRGLDELKQVGNITVQHSWWVLSVGLASLALVTSPFLDTSLVLKLPASIISIVWIVLGAVTIYVSVERVDAELVV